MTLTISRAALLKAIGDVRQIVERRNTIPILLNIRLDAAGGALRLTATDLDIMVATSAPAETPETWSTTLPAATLADIARKLPEGAEVSLAADEAGGRVTLRAGRSRFTLPSLPVSDFPDISAGEMSHSFALPAAALARLIGLTSFAISTDETRYYLNGIYFHWIPGGADGGGSIVAAATDVYRLSRASMPAPAGAAGMPGVIVPRKAVAEIARLLETHGGKGGEAEATISLSTSKIRIEIGGATLVSKLIDGTFPDYQRVIPTGNDKRATLDKPSLAAATDRVSILSSDRGRAVKLSFDEGLLALSVSNPDTGEAREEIQADYTDAPIEVGLNARYVGDCLGALEGDTALLRLDNPGSPIILQSHDGADHLIVLMPMRV